MGEHGVNETGVAGARTGVLLPFWSFFLYFPAEVR
jgi:hypothetical protein